MKNITSILSLLLSLSTLLTADTMFTLSGINKVYPVVDMSGKKIPKTYKTVILEQLLETTEELNIDTSEYGTRSLAVLVNEKYVGEEIVIDIRLIISEQVHRLDDKEKVFAITYADKQHFAFDERFEDNLEDALDTLFMRFAAQYQEENKVIVKVAVEKKSFAATIGYETNYDAALKRAKKEKKNIMLVIVSNYCPWCLKFEDRVLLKKDVNTLIHKKYIPLIINKDKDPFPKRFNKAFSPVVHFIDYKSEQSYASVAGYHNRDEFFYLLKKDSSK
ncbi:MAG: thioredoxin family protein [Campylobacterota bacterium]